MTQVQVVSIYFVTLIVSGVVIVLNASVCYLRTRRVPALKFFTRQQLGTVIAHLSQVLALILLLASIGNPSGAVSNLARLSVWLTVPAEILKAVVWTTLMLSLVGIINGIKPAAAALPLKDGQAVHEAGQAAAFINQISHAAVTTPVPPVAPRAVDAGAPAPDDPSPPEGTA